MSYSYEDKDTFWHRRYMDVRKELEQLQGTVDPIAADIIQQQRVKKEVLKRKEESQIVYKITTLVVFIANGLFDPIVFASNYPHWIVPMIGSIGVSTFGLGGLAFATVYSMIAYARLERLKER